MRKFYLSIIGACLLYGCGGSDFVATEPITEKGGAAGVSGTSGMAGQAGNSGTAGMAGSSAGGTNQGGNSGMGGSGGTDVDSGTGGVAGTSGTGGIAGSSGVGGTGGIDPDSGTGGIAGSSGMGGVSGSSGTGGTGGVVCDNSKAGTQNCPAQSCADVKSNRPTVSKGDYWLKPSSYTGAPFQAWCDMTFQDEGNYGWTLIYAADANNLCPQSSDTVGMPRDNGMDEKISFMALDKMKAIAEKSTKVYIRTLGSENVPVVERDVISKANTEAIQNLRNGVLVNTNFDPNNWNYGSDFVNLAGFISIMKASTSFSGKYPDIWWAAGTWGGLWLTTLIGYDSGMCANNDFGTDQNDLCFSNKRCFSGWSSTPSRNMRVYLGGLMQ